MSEVEDRDPECETCGCEKSWVDCWNGCDDGYFDEYEFDAINFVEGESGRGHRPFDEAWARSALSQARDFEVPFFMKQLGGARPGNKLEDLPEDLRVREFPATVALPRAAK